MARLTHLSGYFVIQFNMPDSMKLHSAVSVWYLWGEGEVTCIMACLDVHHHSTCLLSLTRAAIYLVIV